MDELNWLNEDNMEVTDFEAGAAVMIDKPLHMTSFDVVYKIRKSIKNRLGIDEIKVGHSGTLDPLATGLLILCTGKWTKKLNKLQDLEKEYRGIMCLGAETKTYDAESEPDEFVSVDHLSDEDLVDASESFLGTIVQKPPMYSAAKVKGKPLYKYARAGKEVKVRPRQVTIHRFEIEEREDRTVGFTVSCSKGTYIRSLVHDLGKKLGVGAYLTSLRRTAIGPHRVEDAWQLDPLLEQLDQS